ncbi:MAG: hypothetical protein AAGH15_24685, partial [Myxococcota bacterium]
MESPERSTERARGAAGLVIALAVALWLRLRLGGPFAEAPVPGRPWLAGSDAYAHAHRIRRLIESFPEPVLRDPFLFHPEGTMNEWPLGFDWPLAAGLRLVMAFGASLDAVLMSLPWLPVGLGLVTVVATHRLAGRWLGPAAAFVATLAVGVNVAYLHVSRPGALDHHVVEPLGVVLLLGLPGALARAEPLALRTRALALAALAWCSTLFALLLAGALGLIALEALVRERRAGPGEVVFARWHLVALGAVCSYEAAARGSWLGLATLSLLPFGAAAGALGLRTLVGLVPRRVLVGVALGAPLLGLLLLPGGLGFAAGVIRGTNPFLQRVGESQALFLQAEGPTLRVAHATFG